MTKIATDVTEPAARRWLVYWLYAAALAHLLAGLLLPWLSGMPFLDDYHRSIAAGFWAGAAPTEAHAQQAWWMALFGPTMQSVGLWMFALVQIGHRQRSAAVWAWLIAGIVLWAPQDMLLSQRAGVLANVWLDLFAVATMLPPLVWLWRMDRRGA
ncbi:cell division protein [Pseudoduganella rivuli]|nr:cell division protein [Pseudoduganella rivuli]